MNFADTLKAKPWIPFLILALIGQQANMLTYKFGGEAASPAIFLAYSFLFQALLNAVLIVWFKSCGFPLVLKGKMRPWAVFVGVLYMCNELAFFSSYRAGAPYGLMMVVFSCLSLTFLTVFAFVVLKEKLHMRQGAGLILALISIYLIRMG